MQCHRAVVYHTTKHPSSNNPVGRWLHEVPDETHPVRVQWKVKA